MSGRLNSYINNNTITFPINPRATPLNNSPKQHNTPLTAYTKFTWGFPANLLTISVSTCPVKWTNDVQVLVFLDSHIEATEGWLESLLQRIHSDRLIVPAPAIDNINYETWVRLPAMELIFRRSPIQLDVNSNIRISAVLQRILD